VQPRELFEQISKRDQLSSRGFAKVISTKDGYSAIRFQKAVLRIALDQVPESSCHERPFSTHTSIRDARILGGGNPAERILRPREAIFVPRAE
jgi:hypothetical protein